jgi:glucosamine--fructose-6-phosphate aminotransferase (isomerizing)
MTESQGHFFREIAEQPGLWGSLLEGSDEVEAKFFGLRNLRPQMTNVTGRGSSANAAEILGRTSETWFGVPARFFPIDDASTAHDARAHAAKLDFPPAVSIAVSQSGKSPDLLEAARFLAKRSECLISISSTADCPLSEITDVHLALGGLPELAVAATRTFTGSIVMGLLALAVLGNRIDQVVNALASTIAEGAQALEISQQIPDDLLSDIQHHNRLLVVSSPDSLGVAKEAAIKIAENAGITCVAMSVNDAVHGPIAQVSKKVAVLTLASAAGIGPQLADFHSRVGNAQGRLWSLDSLGFFRPQERKASPYGLSPEWVNLLEVIPVQWLSGRLAERAGHNPDRPKHLEKETFTF